MQMTQFVLLNERYLGQNYDFEESEGNFCYTGHAYSRQAPILN